MTDVVAAAVVAALLVAIALWSDDAAALLNEAGLLPSLAQPSDML